MNTSFGAIATYLDPMLSAANGFAGAFVSTGKVFLSLAFVLEFLNLLLNFWSRGGAQDFIGKVVRLLIVTSIPLAMLIGGASTWSTMTGYITNYFEGQAGASLGVTGSGPSALSNSINGLFTSFSNVITTVQDSGSAGITPGGSGAAAQQVTVCRDQISSQYTPMPRTGVCPPATVATTISAAQMQAQQTGGFLGITGAISHAFHSFVAFAESIVVAGFLGLCFLILLVAMIFAMYGPLLLMSVGVIFGPLLVAWLPFEPLNNLATKWFNYMITMGVAFLVGLVFVKIAGASLDLYAGAIQHSSGSADALMAGLTGLIPACVAMLFMAYMLLKVEHVGAALVGGSAIGGGGAFAAIAAAKMMGAAKATRGLAGGKKDGASSKSSATSATKDPSGAATGSTQAGLSQAAAGASSTPAAASTGGGAAGGAFAQTSGSTAASSAAAQSSAAGGASARSTPMSMGAKALANFGKAASYVAANQSPVAKTLRYGAMGASVAAGPVGVAAAVGGVMATRGAIAAHGKARDIMQARAAAKSQGQEAGSSAAPVSPSARTQEGSSVKSPSPLDLSRQKIQTRNQTRLQARLGSKAGAKS